MGEEPIRWSIKMDRETDIDLRTYLAQQGMKKGDLSKFVQEAVRWRLYDLHLAEVRKGFADLSSDEIEALADEAVKWARTNPDARDH